MSKASKQKAADVRTATPADDAPIRPDKMSRGRRITLIVVAIFCLLIFSVTGPMADTIMGWFGPTVVNVYATVELPSGKTEITMEDYRAAGNLMDFEAGLNGMRADKEFEDVLVYATLMKLADHFEVVTTAEELRLMLLQAVRSASDYENLYRNFGFTRAVDFENTLARAQRVRKMEQLLTAATVVSDADVLKAWHELYDEMRYSFAVWQPAEFAEAAAELTPTEEELQKFYDEGLTPVQRAALEREQSAAFELLVADEAALATPGVQALLGIDAEPSEAALSGFYNRYSLSLYRRPALEPGQTRPEGEGEVFSIAELGPRLARDYRLHAALVQAGLSLPGAPDAAAFATENGLRFESFTEPVKLSELEKLPTYGSFQLRNLFSGEVGTWLQSPVLLPDGLAYLARPTLIQQRELPPLAEIRDAVIGHWREKEQLRLANEAAQAFVAGLPKQSEWVEGDPVTLAPEAFAQALGAERRALTEIDWIARTVRPAADPIWSAEETVKRRARTILSGRLKDLLDGQVIGPEDFGTDGIVVLHLVGRRAADEAKIWPNELQRARSDAQRLAETNFRAEQLSFEGLAKTYGLTKVIAENEDLN